MRYPIVTYPDRLPRWAQLAVAGVAGSILLFIGFVLGVAAAMQEPAPGPTVEIIIPLPKEQPAHPFKPGAFGEPVIYSAQDWEYDSLEDEVKCLADNMYFEGRDQTVKGQIGIGLATINRVKHKHFKNNDCDVVWFQAKDRRSGKMTAHFSWTLDGKSDKITNKKVYGNLYKLAEAMLSEGSLDNFVDFTDGATHYHADYVTPYWADDLNKIAQIGDHIYYKN